jgi:hypothetical protein
MKKTGEWDIRFNSLEFSVLAGIGEDQVLVLVEEEPMCFEACPRLFVHEFQLPRRDLLAYPAEMVESSVVHTFHTPAIPGLECYVALLLVMLES